MDAAAQSRSLLVRHLLLLQLSRSEGRLSRVCEAAAAAAARAAATDQETEAVLQPQQQHLMLRHTEEVLLLLLDARMGKPPLQQWEKNREKQQQHRRQMEPLFLLQLLPAVGAGTAGRTCHSWWRSSGVHTPQKNQCCRKHSSSSWCAAFTAAADETEQ